MRSSDVVQVSALFARVLASLPYYNERAKQSELTKYNALGLRALAADDAESVLVAKVGDDVVGFCISRKDEGLIWMCWIGVESGHRRRGIASNLLKALTARANRVGAHKIWCDCRTNNEASRRMLMMNAYKEICIIPNHWHGQDYILWQKLVG
jgi:ribosomal protein S18 acetylase RimI-like enzyme